MPAKKSESPELVYNHWTAEWEVAGADDAERIERHYAMIGTPDAPKQPPVEAAISEGPVIAEGETAHA